MPGAWGPQGPSTMPPFAQPNRTRNSALLASPGAQGTRAAKHQGARSLGYTSWESHTTFSRDSRVQGRPRDRATSRVPQGGRTCESRGTASLPSPQWLRHPRSCTRGPGPCQSPCTRPPTRSSAHTTAQADHQALGALTKERQQADRCTRLHHKARVGETVGRNQRDGHGPRTMPAPPPYGSRGDALFACLNRSY